MLQFFLIGVGVAILWGAMSVYSDHEEQKDKAKGEVLRDYNKLIKNCKYDPITLNWVNSLNNRFEKFMRSNEYQVRKPYDKFHLKIAAKGYCGLIAFIAVDKNLNLKFVVNFEPSAYDGGKTDLYLKYCIGYGKEIDDFIKKCNGTVMNYNLENKRIRTVEDIINK
jgi:hypothetical protein